MNKENSRLITLINSLEIVNKENIFSHMITMVKSFIKLCDFQDSIRCICALTNDLGYPIKKISKRNKCIKEIPTYLKSNQFYSKE